MTSRLPSLADQKSTEGQISAQHVPDGHGQPLALTGLSSLMILPPRILWVCLASRWKWWRGFKASLTHGNSQGGRLMLTGKSETHSHLLLRRQSVNNWWPAFRAVEGASRWSVDEHPAALPAGVFC